jgi:hypothetical protein
MDYISFFLMTESDGQNFLAVIIRPLKYVKLLKIRFPINKAPSHAFLKVFPLIKHLPMLSFSIRSLPPKTLSIETYFGFRPQRENKRKHASGSFFRHVLHPKT